MRYCLWGHRRGYEQLATIRQRHDCRVYWRAVCAEAIDMALKFDRELKTLRERA